MCVSVVYEVICDTSRYICVCHMCVIVHICVSVCFVYPCVEVYICVMYMYLYIDCMFGGGGVWRYVCMYAHDRLRDKSFYSDKEAFIPK